MNENENNTYININKVAEAKGLKSNRSLRLEINKPESKYIAREVKVNGGTSYEILYSSLEPEIQEKLREGNTKSTALVPLNYPPTTFVSESARLTSLARLDIVKALLNYRKKFTTKKEADSMFLDLYNSGMYLPKVFKFIGTISIGTLHRWIKSYEIYENAECLVPQYKFNKQGEYNTNQIQETVGNSQGSRIYTTDGVGSCLVANAGSGKTGLYCINKPRFNKYKESNIVETLKVGGDTPLMKIRNGTKKGYDIAKVGDGIALAYPNSTTRRGRVGKGCSQTLDTHCNMGTIDGYRIRRLTPTECFRLQGFPDGMIQQARELGISDAQLYKMAGNAITVNVAQTIAEKIAEVENGRA